MPAPANVPEFLDLVRKSNLLPDGHLDQVIDRHRRAGTLPQAIDSFASMLVREGLLTFFQSKQLRLGRYKRFTIGSKYRLLELIGAGGMGAVYLCEHTLMRRLVALKVLPVEKLEDKSNLERFYREARAVAALDHPNIVRAYDIDQFEKLHFLVMEYVDGTSLQEVVARHGRMDPIRAAHYIAQSAVGMQHGHELGMVHRDIKPGNLLLERTGVIKILDMGLARFFNKQQDNVTEKYDDKCVLGTADYLAPEQAVSSMVDIRADIYSLGGTLYFLLTGQTPFPDGTIAAKLVAHQTKEPRPVEEFRGDVPEGMLAVLRRMMEKDPDERFQEPIEVAEALAEWADRPVSLPPAKEMPGLCPAVMVLTGHSVDKVGASTQSMSRVLFAPGRGSNRGAGSSVTNAGALTASGSNSHSGEVRLEVRGPSSTARASAAPTSPIPNRHDSEVAFVASGAGSGSVVYVQPPRRTGLFIVVGIIIGVLFAGGAVAAFYLGKSSNTTPPKVSRQTPAPPPVTPSVAAPPGDAG
ncbi:MAG TPA: protein kinase [Gemmataceae bacterium]|nr:protein kinase [Gemmataceae bacterium]